MKNRGYFQKKRIGIAIRGMLLIGLVFSLFACDECREPVLKPIGDHYIEYMNPLSLKIRAFDPDTPQGRLRFEMIQDFGEGMPSIADICQFNLQNQVLNCELSGSDMEYWGPYRIIFRVCDDCPDGPLCDEEAIILKPCSGAIHMASEKAWNRIYWPSDGIKKIEIEYFRPKNRISVHTYAMCEDGENGHFGCIYGTDDLGTASTRYYDYQPFTVEYNVEWGKMTLTLDPLRTNPDTMTVIENRYYDDGSQETLQHPLGAESSSDW